MILFYIFVKMQINKNKILEEIFKNSELKSYAFKVAKGNSLYEDIISEIILYLNNLDDSKLFRLYESKEIFSYCYKIIWLSWNSTTSPFYIKYLKKNSQDFIISETKKKYCEAYLLDELNKMEKLISRFPTEIKVFEVYLKLGSLRKVSKETGIPHTTVQYLVNRVKAELIKKI